MKERDDAKFLNSTRYINCSKERKNTYTPFYAMSEDVKSEFILLSESYGSYNILNKNKVYLLLNAGKVLWTYDVENNSIRVHLETLRLLESNQNERENDRLAQEVSISLRQESFDTLNKFCRIQGVSRNQAIFMLVESFNSANLEQRKDLIDFEISKDQKYMLRINERVAFLKSQRDAIDKIINSEDRFFKKK